MSRVPGADRKMEGEEEAGARVQFSRHCLGNCAGLGPSGHTVLLSVPQRRSSMLLLLCPFIGQVGKRPQRLGTHRPFGFQVTLTWEGSGGAHLILWKVAPFCPRRGGATGLSQLIVRLSERVLDIRY